MKLHFENLHLEAKGNQKFKLVIPIYCKELNEGHFKEKNTSLQIRTTKLSHLLHLYGQLPLDLEKPKRDNHPLLAEVTINEKIPGTLGREQS